MRKIFACVTNRDFPHIPPQDRGNVSGFIRLPVGYAANLPFLLFQISPTSSESLPSRKNTGITSRGAETVTVCPPS